MAIGLARHVQRAVPAEFQLAVQGASVIDYWQRWHMTLTRYLTLYLYNPLALRIRGAGVHAAGGPTRGAQATPRGFAAMVLFPTFITMALAGIWHGSGLTFLVFGLLHAVYLIVNHAWRVLRPGAACSVRGRARGRARSR